MKKFYTTLAISAVVAMSGTAADWQFRGELNASLKVENAKAASSLRHATVLPEITVDTPAPSLKADGVDISGNYDITVYDCYFQDSSGKQEEYPLTITITEGVAILDAGNKWGSQVGAIYDATTGNLKFIKVPLGAFNIGGAVYYVQFEPFVYDEATKGAVQTDYTVNYNAATQSFSFQPSHGFMWAAYEDDKYTTFAGYVDAFDVISINKAQSGDTNEGWTSIGEATFMDGWLMPATGLDQSDPANQYGVELQRNDADKNVYRLVNPYKGKSPMAQFNESKNNGYIQFDVTDPEHVVFAGTEAGFANSQLGITKFYCHNTLGLLSATYSRTPAEVIEVLGDELPYTTFKNGVVSLTGITTSDGKYEYDASFGDQSNNLGGWIWQTNAGAMCNMDCKIIFPANFEGGVEGVTADAVNGPVKYFNLQGQPVAAPAPGTLVIRQAGDKVEKIIIR